MTEHIYNLAAEDLAQTYEEFTAQTSVTEAARILVQTLRDVDKTSPYTSIDSKAGRAEINYNIQKAQNLNIADYYTDIQLWTTKYIKWYEQFGTGRDINTYTSFREFYTDINRIHLNSMLKNHKFDCKCSTNLEHSYIYGSPVCAMGNKMTLVNMETAHNTLGYIGYNYPYLIYPSQF